MLGCKNRYVALFFGLYFAFIYNVNAQTRTLSEWLELVKANVDKNPRVVQMYYAKQVTPEFAARCAAIATNGLVLFSKDPQLALNNQQGALNTAVSAIVTGVAMEYMEANNMPVKQMYKADIKNIQTVGIDSYMKDVRRCNDLAAAAFKESLPSSKK